MQVLKTSKKRKKKFPQKKSGDTSAGLPYLKHDADPDTAGVKNFRKKKAEQAARGK